ncbi:MAG TPA: hypothetical protein VNR51_04075, partial [Hyphomicrobium sp.]|nr:hypothetical protein [Hyphomicrobium sp.]
FASAIFSQSRHAVLRNGSRYDQHQLQLRIIFYSRGKSAWPQVVVKDEVTGPGQHPMAGIEQARGSAAAGAD